MDLDKDRLERIKKIAIISLFSDDDLMNKFVLKGGNALNIVYKLGQRASIDIDVSMDNDVEDIKVFKDKLTNLIIQNFKENGYLAFDIKLTEKPHKIPGNLRDFWGGYCLEFKVIEKEKAAEFDNDMEKIRKSALNLGNGTKKNFKIDISKYEYCDAKQEEELEDFTIYVYSPTMIVCEKLRAICQQNRRYKEIVTTMTPKSRPKDFYDIYYILEHLAKINLAEEDTLLMLKAIFDVKKVPLSFLGELESDRELHKGGFESVKATIEQNNEVKEFDFYFDYVRELVESIKFFWKEQMPTS